MTAVAWLRIRRVAAVEQGMRIIIKCEATKKKEETTRTKNEAEERDAKGTLSVCVCVCVQCTFMAWETAAKNARHAVEWKKQKLKQKANAKQRKQQNAADAASSGELSMNHQRACICLPEQSRAEQRERERETGFWHWNADNFLAVCLWLSIELQVNRSKLCIFNITQSWEEAIIHSSSRECERERGSACVSAAACTTNFN